MKVITMRKAFLVLVLLALALPIGAAGTVTVSPEQFNVPDVFPYTVAWTSDASGVVSADATGNTLTVVEGRLTQVRIVPAAAGSAPTTLYDMTIVDSSGIDVLNGEGTDLSATVGVYFVFDPPVILTKITTLDLVVANAGNAKSGTVTVWITR